MKYKARGLKFIPIQTSDIPHLSSVILYFSQHSSPAKPVISQPMRTSILISGFVFLSVLAVVMTGGSGCANIVPPQGGPRDTIPPVLLKASPADSSRNFKGNKLVFTFDEFVDVQDIQNNLLVSPLARITPSVDARLREITVKIKDSLEANTTYSFDFGKAIKDINEGNVMKDFRFTFSTGPYIDSLELQGTVLIAETAKPDSTLLVILHTSKNDSAVVKEKPKYAARLDNQGRFHFKNLPPQTFYLYALKDDGGMKRYMNDKQLFAFADAPVTIGEKNDSLVLYAFAKKEAAPATTPDLAGQGGRNKPGNTAADKRLKFQINLSSNQQDLLDELKLNFESPLKNFDSTGLTLFTDSSYTPVKDVRFVKDSTSMTISIKTVWQEKTLYNLILNRDFAEDSTGKKLLKTDTLSFISKKKADYGILKIRFRNLDLEKNPVLQIILGQALHKSFPLTSPDFIQTLFNPGDYELRILFDANKNGQWDPGEFFGKHLQTERVQPIPRKVTVKANWTNEFDIDLKQ